MSDAQQDLLLQSWTQRQELAEQILPIIGRLYRNNGVALRFVRTAMFDSAERRRIYKEARE